MLEKLRRIEFNVTVTEAYKILGLPPGSEWNQIKKEYRKLMMQTHPDTGSYSKSASRYTAQEINLAYEFLKKNPPVTAERKASGTGRNPSGEKKTMFWNAPVNPNACREREILHNAEDYDGTVLGNFCIARGKYFWTQEEDFSLFLLSIYRCSKEILDEADAALGRDTSVSVRQPFQAELAYLLAQQFIGGISFLQGLAKEETAAPDGRKIFYFLSMLELSSAKNAPGIGEILYPSAIRKHRLYLKNQMGRELGYLSFPDDRLYYVIIPLLEHKSVQIRIQVSENQPAKRKNGAENYRNLHLWIRPIDQAIQNLPENLNGMIEGLITKYKKQLSSSL